MVYFQTKNSNLGKFCRSLPRLENVYIGILWPFGIFFGHLGYFMNIWFICVHFVHFFWFVIMYHEKSGNPGRFASKLVFTQVSNFDLGS
jgi:hypothetical protein